MVDKIDVVSVFVEIPEKNANQVRAGTKATVLAKAYRDQPIPASVTRTSWVANVKPRVLRAEIDLPNSDGRLKPGIYAAVGLVTGRTGVRALPVTAIESVDDRTYFWICQNGHAVRTAVETGVSDGQWIEVIKHRVPASQTAAPGDEPWMPIDGSEPVILDDVSNLQDGAPVQVVPGANGLK